MDRDEILATALGDALREQREWIENRLASSIPITNGHSVGSRQVNAIVEFPAPVITNEVQSPEVVITNEGAVVHIDMAPVAAAIDRMTDMISQLIQVLSEQSPPTVKVDSLPPNITVKVPAREKRSMTITHSDGTTSKVKEE